MLFYCCCFDFFLLFVYFVVVPKQSLSVKILKQTLKCLFLMFYREQLQVMTVYLLSNDTDVT